jgi:5'-3' exonuclease
MQNSAPGQITDQSIIDAVCKQIHSYIKLVKPTETVIIAFDGVAPVAKLENQRNRRYKSEFTASIMEKAGVVKNSWDTTAITPGTPFMEKLDSGLNEYFGKHYQKKFSAKQVIVSSSFEAGEGEHKIFEFIRSNQSKHQQERTVIYGLDADLIMLSINHLHYCRNLFLFRETPHFIRSLNRNLDPGELYVLDINELFAGVCDGIYGRAKHKTPDHITYALPYDYVFLVSLLGNDYMPHNPAFSIRTGGLDVVIGAYKRFVESTRSKALPGSLLTDGEHINWDNFRTYMRTLAAMEEDLFLKEHKYRESLAKRPFSLRKDNSRRSSNGTSNGSDKEISLEDEMMQRLNAIPVYNREKEKYIEPTEPYWQERYYVALFGSRRKTIGASVCVAYLEALEWTMRYYTSGCVNWRWAYPYAYAPLFSDLIEHIPSSGSALPESQELDNTPVSPLTQLSYVLPISAQHMIPTSIRNELRDKLEDKYGTNWEFEWSYCRYFWESHAIMPHIDVDYLERLVSKCGK